MQTDTEVDKCKDCKFFVCADEFFDDWVMHDEEYRQCEHALGLAEAHDDACGFFDRKV